MNVFLKTTLLVTDSNSLTLIYIEAVFRLKLNRKLSQVK